MCNWVSYNFLETKVSAMTWMTCDEDESDAKTKLRKNAGISKLLRASGLRSLNGLKSVETQGFVRFATVE